MTGQGHGGPPGRPGAGGQDGRVRRRTSTPAATSASRHLVSDAARTSVGPGSLGRGRTGQHHLGPPSPGGGESPRRPAAVTVPPQRTRSAPGDDRKQAWLSPPRYCARRRRGFSPLSARTPLRPDGDLLRVGGLAPSALIRRGRPTGSALFSGASPGRLLGAVRDVDGRPRAASTLSRSRVPPVLRAAGAIAAADGDRVHSRRWQAPGVGAGVGSLAGRTAPEEFCGWVELLSPGSRCGPVRAARGVKGERETSQVRWGVGGRTVTTEGGHVLHAPRCTRGRARRKGTHGCSADH